MTAGAGTVSIGGDLAIHRLGFGAMRIVGRGVFGPPTDLERARATLRCLPELGVDFVDTAIAYGPILSELLVRETLHPYAGMVIATKGGFLRPGPGQWVKDGRPEALRTAVENSLRVLGLERIDLWQLHHLDDKVPADETFAAIAEMQRAGLIRHAGLCNVSVEEIEAARKHFAVATVQNPYHVMDRKSESVLAWCEREGVPFIAYYPLAVGALAAADSILGRVAARLGATAAQVALAWLLKRSKIIVVIPGTQNPDHARENAGAASVALSDDDYAEIESLGRKAAMLRGDKWWQSSIIG